MYGTGREVHGGGLDGGGTLGIHDHTGWCRIFEAVVRDKCQYSCL